MEKMNEMNWGDFMAVADGCLSEPDKVAAIYERLTGHSAGSAPSARAVYETVITAARKVTEPVNELRAEQPGA